MSMPDTVVANQSPSESGCWDANRSNFICCVDGREPNNNEVWILGEDRLTPEVHLTARVDVGANVDCKLATNSLTGNGFNASIFCK